MDAGKPEMAVVSFEKALSLDPKSNAAAAELVRALFASNRKPEAEKQLTAILADPGFTQPELLEKAAGELKAGGDQGSSEIVAQAARMLREKQPKAQ